MNLELMAMRWLWLEKDCHYILEQRSPRPLGVPDVIGITKSRYLIEVEVKRTASDFRADARKHSRQIRERYLSTAPKFFYYMMPVKLAEKLRPEIPEWAGLMCNAENQVTATILKPAPSNKESRRLNLDECVRTVRMMCNHMMTTKEKISELFSNYKFKDTGNFVHWVDTENGTYTI